MNDEGAVTGWGRAWRPTDTWIPAVIGSALLLRIVSVLLSGASVFPDSKSYRSSFLDLSQTSLTGYSVRPWGVTLWMTLWPSLTVLILAQALLAIACWGALAREIWLLCRTRTAARAALVLVMLVSSLPAIACWDAAVMSESVSISTGVLSLALLLRALRLQTWWALGWFVLATLWFAATRPLSLVVVLSWIVVCLVALLVVRGNRAGWAVTAVALLVISGYAYLINQRADDAWTARYGFSRTTSTYGYNIGWSPIANSVLAAVRKTDAPACMIPAKPAEVGRHGPAFWVGTTAAVCPGMNEWATTHWQSFYRHYLITHPSQAMTIIDVQLPKALSTTVYGDYRSGVPLSVQDLFVAQTGQPSTPKTSMWVTVPVLAWMSAALVLLLLAWRVLRRRDVPVWLALLAAVFASLLSMVAAVLVIQVPLAESGRENVASNSLMIVAAVALAVLGADRVAGRRTATDATAPDAGGPSGTETPASASGEAEGEPLAVESSEGSS